MRQGETARKRPTPGATKKIRTEPTTKVSSTPTFHGATHSIHFEIPPAPHHPPDGGLDVADEPAPDST
ncbi:MAG TPA: hypothetical protein VFW70_10775, partial [Methylomirabilota bacterium]|nr:hypothetical protein [Methylomirabilota bacterium]